MEALLMLLVLVIGIAATIKITMYEANKQSLLKQAANNYKFDEWYDNNYSRCQLEME